MMTERVRTARKEVESAVAELLGVEPGYRMNIGDVALQLSDESPGWNPQPYKRINLSGGYGMPRSFVKIDEVGKWKEKLPVKVAELAEKIKVAKEAERLANEQRQREHQRHRQLAELIPTELRSRIEYFDGRLKINLGNWSESKRAKLIQLVCCAIKQLNTKAS